MKKFYSALALASAFSLSAVAGSHNVSMQKADFVGFEGQQPLSEVIPQSKMQKEMNVTKAEDLVGAYFMEYSSCFDQDDQSGTVLIEKGEGANDLLIYGLMQRGALKVGGYAVKATVDIAKGQISIPQQVIDPNWSETEGALKLYPYDLQKQSMMAAAVIDIAELGLTNQAGEHLYEEGCLAALNAVAIVFSTDADMAGVPKFSGYAGPYFEVLTPVSLYGTEGNQIFEYNAADWKSCGQGSFNEGFMNNGGLFDPVAAYSVEVMQKVDGSQEFLIVNPYGENTPWKTVNSDASKSGYIYINATNPDMVLVKPAVYSGYRDEQIFPLGQLFFANKEGSFYYIDEYSYDEIAEEFDFFGDTPSTAAFSGDKVTINIRNGLVSNVCDMFNYGAFQFGDDIVSCQPSTLEFKMAGIEGVINDAENVPARYFNLQGVEIANPEAGQVVIVKKGNEAFKTIAK